MTECKSRSKINRLLIPVTGVSLPPGIPASSFEMFGGRKCLRLFVDAEKYVPIWDQSDDAITYKDTGIGQYAPFSSARYGFEATVDNHHASLPDILMLIAQKGSDFSLERYMGITVYDFVRPSWTELLQDDDGQQYTIRVGRIYSLQEKGGTIGRGSKLYGKGVTFRFQEQVKRRFLS